MPMTSLKTADGVNDEEGAVEDDDSAASQSFTNSCLCCRWLISGDRLPVDVQPLTAGLSS